MEFHRGLKIRTQQAFCHIARDFGEDGVLFVLLLIMNVAFSELSPQGELQFVRYQSR